jgi:hypothetical protein
MNADTGVACPGAAGDKGNAGLAGQLAIRLGGVRRAILMAARDNPDTIPNIIQSVQGGEITLPRHAENRIDPMQNQGINQNLTTRAQFDPHHN